MPGLWDNIKSLEVALPVDIIKEITDSFNESFAGQLEMNIFQKTEDVVHAFADQLMNTRKDVQSNIFVKLEAPLLRNYQLAVLSVVYEISTVYPCKLTDNLNMKAYICANSDELQVNLYEIFSSDKFKTSASMILTQVKHEMANP